MRLNFYTVLLAFFTLLTTTSAVYGQSNLFPNEGFEDFGPYQVACGSWDSDVTGIGGCPNGRLSCRLDKWYEPGGGNTNLYTTCDCPAIGTGIFACQDQNPYIPVGAPILGNGAIWMYPDEGIPDYLAVRLQTPLRAGFSYLVTVNVNTLNQGPLPAPALGYYFTHTPYTWAFGELPDTNIFKPQIYARDTGTVPSMAYRRLETVLSVPAGSGDLEYVQIGPSPKEWQRWLDGLPLDGHGEPDLGSYKGFLLDGMMTIEITPFNQTLQLHHVKAVTAHQVELSYELSSVPIRLGVEFGSDDLTFHSSQLLDEDIVSAPNIKAYLPANARYARLFTEDANGHRSYSNVVEIAQLPNSPRITLVSNPMTATQASELSWQGIPPTSAVRVELFRTDGGLQQAWDMTGSDSLILPSDLAAGVYWLHLSSGQVSWSQAFLVQL